MLFRSKADVLMGRQYGDYEYMCVDCYAYYNYMPVEVARREIKQKRTAKGIERCKAYECAILACQEDFKFLLIECGDDDDDNRSVSTDVPSESGAASSAWDGDVSATPESGLAETHSKKAASNT